jgi:putative copper resistance protein D
MPDGFVVLARWLQLAAALVLFGAAVFARYGLNPQRWTGAWWLRPLLLIGAAVALLATGGWLLAEAASFADEPQQPLVWSTVRVVVFETRFGAMALLRLLLLAMMLVVLLAAPMRRALLGLAALAAAAVASFVGTGHGTSPGGLSGGLHALADALHLWAAGLWLGALVPLWLLAATAGDEAGIDELTRGLLRFSAIGPVVVAVLTLSGVINAALLLGPAPWHALFTSDYGRTLLIKLALFALMLLCAAINRYALTPRLSTTRSAPVSRSALRRLRAVLGLETAVAFVLIAAVAWLGALAPPE